MIIFFSIAIFNWVSVNLVFFLWVLNLRRLKLTEGGIPAKTSS